MRFENVRGCLFFLSVHRGVGEGEGEGLGLYVVYELVLV